MTCPCPYRRFGHAVVRLGDTVVAVGGSRLHPDVMLDSVERLDEDRGWVETEVRLQQPRANFGYALVPHSLLPGCRVTEK